MMFCLRWELADQYTIDIKEPIDLEDSEASQESPSPIPSAPHDEEKKENEDPQDASAPVSSAGSESSLDEQPGPVL